jgi:hypothetical protein
MMKAFKLLALAGTLIMFLTLLYGFVAGDFFKEGSILMSLAWGKVSLIDVYIGFFLFSGWVIFREDNWLASASWIILIMILGNFITCLYVTVNLFRFGEDPKRFWLGNNFQDKG